MCLIGAMNNNALQKFIDVELSSKLVVGNPGMTEKYFYQDWRTSHFKKGYSCCSETLEHDKTFCCLVAKCAAHISIFFGNFFYIQISQIRNPSDIVKNSRSIATSFKTT